MTIAAVGLASAALATSAAVPERPPSHQDQASQFQNLQVLPADASDDVVFGAMFDNLRGLGLPRRDGEGCLYCHVGSMDTPRDTWDYASDDRLEKRKARQMMAMVAAINDRHLGELESRSAPDLRVTCATCHAGRTDPRPLPDVLRTAHAAGGVDALVSRYEELRERYFAADAYDFRPSVLSGIAVGLAGQEAFDDALAVALLNARFYPDEGSAHRTAVLVELQRAYFDDGAAGAVAEFDAQRRGDRAEWIDFQVLDSLGWGTFRQGDERGAIALFAHNLATYPDEYIPHESLADAHFFASEPDEDEAARLYELWLAKHPDDETARRRLRDVRAEQ